MTTPRIATSASRSHGVLLMTVAAAVLMPWIAFLATSLPMRHAAHHWRLTWVGFDIALAGTFLGAAIAGRRRSSSFPDFLIAAGVLLICDAWFDLITASTTHELIVAAAEALCVEIPIALACFALSRRWRDEDPITPADQGAAVRENELLRLDRLTRRP